MCEITLQNPVTGKIVWHVPDHIYKSVSRILDGNEDEIYEFLRAAGDIFLKHPTLTLSDVIKFSNSREDLIRKINVKNEIGKKELQILVEA